MGNFCKVNIALTCFRDAEKLDDPKNDLSPREREMAEPLRKVPSFWDWTNYMMLLVQAATFGAVTEYRPSMEYLNNAS